MRINRITRDACTYRRVAAHHACQHKIYGRGVSATHHLDSSLFASGGNHSIKSSMRMDAPGIIFQSIIGIAACMSACNRVGIGARDAIILMTRQTTHHGWLTIQRGQEHRRAETNPCQAERTLRHHVVFRQ
ncbi:hypothetical protein BJY04DRAFT_19511 [Aspergillus karnatakaensis]|uniref:uncharacterized protein n=1 Tax=Aspergillus karnatakaensis TaxID=1810916 RepID=UPI003CCD75AC